MDKVYVIRHKVLVERLSGRSVARELGVSRNTVSKYLQTSEPVRKPVARCLVGVNTTKARHASGGTQE